MNDRVPKERLGTTGLNDVFPQILHTSKFQELEIGSDSTFMQSYKIKLCMAYFSQNKKMWNKKIAQNLSYIFFWDFGSKRDSSLQINC